MANYVYLGEVYLANIKFGNLKTNTTFSLADEPRIAKDAFTIPS